MPSVKLQGRILRSSSSLCSQLRNFSWITYFRQKRVPFTFSSKLRVRLFTVSIVMPLRQTFTREWSWAISSARELTVSSKYPFCQVQKNPLSYCTSNCLMKTVQGRTLKSSMNLCQWSSLTKDQNSGQSSGPCPPSITPLMNCLVSLPIRVSILSSFLQFSISSLNEMSPSQARNSCKVLQDVSYVLVVSLIFLVSQCPKCLTFSRILLWNNEYSYISTEQSSPDANLASCCLISWRQASFSSAKDSPLSLRVFLDFKLDWLQKQDCISPFLAYTLASYSSRSPTNFRTSCFIPFLESLDLNLAAAADSRFDCLQSYALVQSCESCSVRISATNCIVGQNPSTVELRLACTLARVCRWCYRNFLLLRWANLNSQNCELTLAQIQESFGADINQQIQKQRLIWTWRPKAGSGTVSSKYPTIRLPLNDRVPLSPDFSYFLKASRERNVSTVKSQSQSKRKIMRKKQVYSVISERPRPKIKQPSEPSCPEEMTGFKLDLFRMVRPETKEVLKPTVRPPPSTCYVHSNLLGQQNVKRHMPQALMTRKVVHRSKLRQMNNLFRAIEESGGGHSQRKKRAPVQLDSVLSEVFRRNQRKLI